MRNEGKKDEVRKVSPHEYNKYIKLISENLNKMGEEQRSIFDNMKYWNGCEIGYGNGRVDNSMLTPTKTLSIAAGSKLTIGDISNLFITGHTHTSTK